MIGELIPYLAPTLVLLLILGSAIKILPEYERGVVFSWGAFRGQRARPDYRDPGYPTTGQG